ncbi:MAG: universal stress protein [Thermodesulfobacteriota bacterium]|nr:universal stress protein [Thermodesulfobacteriota bacterium]
MERKILVAVDDSIHSKQAVEYAVTMSSVVESLAFTLFHVQPTISLFLLDEAKADFGAQAKLEAVSRKNARDAQEVLRSYKARMVRMGIPEGRIDVATRPKSMGLVKDILDHAEQGLYDAIVVGRRGLSGIQRAFMGSVTAKLVDHSRVVPVWVVDGKVASKRILLAIDGSESSLRALDHLTFMCGENPDIKVTLFHVTPTLSDYCVINFEEKHDGIEDVVTRGARQCVDQFYAHAQKKFSDAGLSEDQIEIKVRNRTLNVGKAILEEANKGKYGTVVVGRRGANNAFFMGKVSRSVLDRMSALAVWLIS